MLSKEFIEEMKQALLSKKALLETDLKGLHSHTELGSDEDSNIQEVEDDEESRDVMARIKTDLEKIDKAKLFRIFINFEKYGINSI